jgi:hypothetical protein
MANEVRMIVEQEIRDSVKELTVYSIQAKYPEFDYLDIIAAFKKLELEGFGVMAVGRRGLPTRFIKGACRVPLLSNNEIELLTSIISSLPPGTEVTLGDSKCLSIMVDDTPVFTARSRAALLEGASMMDKQGLGLFIIGRKGKMSRFIVGMSKADFLPTSRTFASSEIVEDQKQYNVLNGILFQAPNGVHATLDAAMKEANLDSSVRNNVIENVAKFGYYKFQ